jgi:hypothetical protein
VSRVVFLGLVAVLMLLFVSGCASRPSDFTGSWLGSDPAGGTSPRASNESTGAVAATRARPTSIATAKPVDAYVLLGGRIKSCWFNASYPLLPQYVYRADVSPSGRKVQITIHQRQALGRAGLITYAVFFKEEGPYTVVLTQNRGMPPRLAAKMKYDIDRWQRGESNCNTVMPATAAASATR